MKIFKAILCLICLILVACIIHKSNVNLKTGTVPKDYDQILTKLEQQAVDKNTDNLGVLLYEIDFRVKTNNLADYKEGFIPRIELEHPETNLPNLADKDQIAVNEPKVTVIIDYPLTNEYRFTLANETGFTKEQLVKEISKHYYTLYQEEETTATIKTIPKNKRKTVYNRNQTNGKYGIWGHDIADLVLANILVYKSASGEILLSLNIES